MRTGYCLWCGKRPSRCCCNPLDHQPRKTVEQQLKPDLDIRKESLSSLKFLDTGRDE